MRLQAKNAALATEIAELKGNLAKNSSPGETQADHFNMVAESSAPKMAPETPRTTAPGFNMVAESSARQDLLRAESATAQRHNKLLQAEIQTLIGAKSRDRVLAEKQYNDDQRTISGLWHNTGIQEH